MSDMQIVSISVDDLKPYAKNAKKHSEKLVFFRQIFQNVVMGKEILLGVIGGNLRNSIKKLLN